MQLIVPTPFQADFLDKLSGSPCSHLYGSLPEDPGMRPKRWLPAADQEALAGHVELARSLGIGFIYALNPSCLGNREFTGEGQRWLAERLGWLKDIGVEGVATAIPLLVEMIKQRFPELKVHISVVANVNSLDKALFYQKLGADVLYVATDRNRDFRFLRALKSAVRCEVVVLVNEGCFLHCPMREYHANLVSHSSESLDRGAYIDYCTLKCTAMKVREPSLLLKSPWVPPEALAMYEKLGIAWFKLAGRDKSPAWLLRAIEAYSTRSYPGDLVELIAGFDELASFGPLPAKIDNSSLRGFMDGFRDRDCSLGCGDCRYCDEWALRAVASDQELGEQYAQRLEHTLKIITSGTFRAPLVSPRGTWPQAK